MGDKRAAPQLRGLFEHDPEGLIRLGGGDVAEAVKARLAAIAVPRNDILAREARLLRVDQVRDELAGLNPTPIERLLAERAAYCQFEMNVLDAMVLDRWEEGLEGRRAADLDRYRDRAQRRLLAALKALAAVRKLALPAIQLNVGKNQVNLANPPHPAGSGR